MHRDQLPIHEPCHADWSAMSGDQARRFCGSCTKHVHDLSAMTAPAAAELVKTSEDLCVRYTVGADGEIVHARRLPRILALGVALLGAATPAFASGAARPSTEPTWVDRVVEMAQKAVGYTPETVVSQGQVVVMGEMPPPPPPPPEPVVLLGKIMPPPVILLPAPGESVIPEVEAALQK